MTAYLFYPPPNGMRTGANADASEKWGLYAVSQDDEESAST